MTPPRKHDIEITPAVVAKVRRQFPSAVRSTIRAAGKCPVCKQPAQVSFQTPDDWDRPMKDGWESCGWYCVNCGWGNCGSRLVNAEDES